MGKEILDRYTTWLNRFCSLQNKTRRATRGKSGYDAVLHWLPNTEPDIAGYSVLMRSTTSPVWEKETWLGNVTGYTMPDVSIDDVVIGVKAVDKDGNQSIVSPYMEPVLPSMITPSQAR